MGHRITVTVAALCVAIESTAEHGSRPPPAASAPVTVYPPRLSAVPALVPPLVPPPPARLSLVPAALVSVPRPAPLPSSILSAAECLEGWSRMLARAAEELRAEAEAELAARRERERSEAPTVLDRRPAPTRPPRARGGELVRIRRAAA